MIERDCEVQPEEDHQFITGILPPVFFVDKRLEVARLKIDLYNTEKNMDTSTDALLIGQTPGGGNLGGLDTGRNANAGNVHTHSTPEHPHLQAVGLTSAAEQPVYVRVCEICGQPATVESFLADVGKIPLCPNCFVLFGFDAPGARYAEIPY